MESKVTTWNPWASQAEDLHLLCADSDVQRRDKSHTLILEIAAEIWANITGMLPSQMPHVLKSIFLGTFRFTHAKVGKELLTELDSINAKHH